MEHLHVDPDHTVIVEGERGLQQMTGQQWNDWIDLSDRADPGYTLQVASTHPSPDDAALWLTSKGLEL
jgi:hypothetical protein